MKKVYKSISSSLKDVIFDGMSIAVGGFGLCGIPENLILGLKEFGVKDLKIISKDIRVIRSVCTT